MWRKLGLAVLILAIVAGSCFAWGEPRRGSPGRGGGERHGKMLEQVGKKLGLTKEQLKTAKAIEGKQRSAMEANRKQTDRLMEDIKTEVDKQQPDRNKIRAMIKSIGELHTDMQIIRMDTLLDFKKGLTPTQQEKFKHLMEKDRFKK